VISEDRTEEEFVNHEQHCQNSPTLDVM